MSNDQNAKKSIDTKSAILSPDQQAMLDSLIFCATTQESVNTAMTGADWREKAKGLATTASGLTVDYPMALLDEAAEFWASAVNFKWWAKTDFVFDRKNAEVELIDMLHFGLSQDLIERTPEEVAKKAFDALVYVLDTPESLTVDARGPMKDFIHGITAKTPVVDWKAFWRMAERIDLNPTRLITKYRAKAVLNKFRTQCGAANGSYNKKWLDGKEDNFYLMNWLDSEWAEGTPTDEQITNWLTTSYARVGSKSTL